MIECVHPVDDDLNDRIRDSDYIRVSAPKGTCDVQYRDVREDGGMIGEPDVVIRCDSDSEGTELAQRVIILKGQPSGRIRWVDEREVGLRRIHVEDVYLDVHDFEIEEAGRYVVEVRHREEWTRHPSKPLALYLTVSTDSDLDAMKRRIDRVTNSTGIPGRWRRIPTELATG